MTKTSAPVRTELQTALKRTVDLPTQQDFHLWANAAVLGSRADISAGACITIRLVESDESCDLNALYRNIDKPTNVLAFAAAMPLIADLPDADTELGDLVICLEVVEREAREQRKSVFEHLAHMVVHGTLHLLGYDHQTDVQAVEMETLEIAVMQDLGFTDPYDNHDED